MRFVNVRSAAVALAFTAAFGVAGAVTTLATADAAPISVQAASTSTFKAGPVEVDATVDSATLSADIVSYVNVPVVGKIKLGETKGSLQGAGITVNLNYSDVLSGSVKISVGAGKNVVASYDFTSFGHHYSGSSTIGHL